MGEPNGGVAMLATMAVAAGRSGVDAPGNVSGDV